jgi:transposase InsO family protein
MPWKAISIMSLRHEFVQMAQETPVSFSKLCYRFKISRKTGYKWLRRYFREGISGLADQSRRPHRIVFKVVQSVEEAIVTLRNKHQTWGARKLRRKLQDAGITSVPACSTITAVLHRHGLINPEEPGGRQDWQRFEHPVPNSLWQMDFKGPVQTLRGSCYPLTILDDHSRFSLCLEALSNQQTDGVQQTLTVTFQRYGLPNTMVMDHGSPWGRDVEHPYTALTAWLIRLGISISHSRPYHPQTLGKDERFHRTLQRDLLSRFQWQDPLHLQRTFDSWRHEYNFERPHEALNLAVPASRYRPSLRCFPEQLPPIEYPSGMEVRKVQEKGEIFFRGRTFIVGKAFHRYPVGIKPTPHGGVFDVLFCHEVISQIDMRITQ